MTYETEEKLKKIVVSTLFSILSVVFFIKIVIPIFTDYVWPMLTETNEERSQRAIAAAAWTDGGKVIKKEFKPGYSYFLLITGHAEPDKYILHVNTQNTVTGRYRIKKYTVTAYEYNNINVGDFYPDTGD